MSEFEDSICIAYPTEWPDTIDEPHSTLIWLGNISEAQFTKDQVMSAIGWAKIPEPGEIKTAGLTFFGENKDIPVVLLEKDKELLAYRRRIELELARHWISDASEFEYNPHVSLSYDPDFKVDDIEIPDTIYLKAPVLWWGDER